MHERDRHVDLSQIRDMARCLLVRNARMRSSFFREVVKGAAGARTRRAVAAVGLLVAAFASLATSEDSCPRAVSLSDTAQLEPSTSATHRYRVAASGIQEVHVIVSGTSAGSAEVRVRLEPDDPTLFTPISPLSDAGVSQTVDLALRSATSATADLTLPRCLGCQAYDFSLFVEHVAGDAASLRWDVVVETDNCNEDFHARIDRR